MSYTKNTWQTGDIITAAKLNHIEDGVKANDPFVIEITAVDDNPDETGAYPITCSAPFSDIVNHINDAVVIFMGAKQTGNFTTSIDGNGTIVGVTFSSVTYDFSSGMITVLGFNQDNYTAKFREV